jgi:hypothetical protein
MISLLVALLPTLAVAGADSVAVLPAATPYEQVSLLLYPDTATWTPTRELPAAPGALLRQQEGQLKTAYLASGYAKSMGDDGADDISNCSMITRVFSKEYGFPSGFSTQDVNGDGHDDIVYTGSAQCREGDLTLIWSGSPRGYLLAHIYGELALRWQVGKSLIAFVAVGCCADPVDVYWTTAAPGKSNAIGISKDTEIPAAAGPRTAFVAGAELALRSSPKVENDYDEGASAMNGMAVFGNILSRYMAGAKGQVIVRNGSWCFGVLDAESDRFRLSAPIDARASWFECSAIETASVAGTLSR